jgi:ADP-ribose pyrophosphatase YjhB (NUDIX family)
LRDNLVFTDSANLHFKPEGRALPQNTFHANLAIVGNDNGEILLMKRADSGIWLYPTGWADVGYSPAEVAMKEVHEETGIECEVLELLGVVDGMRMGFSRFGMYMLLFRCRATGGSLSGHPLETADVGWFGRDNLPSPAAGVQWWGPMAFNAIDGKHAGATFDAPRQPVWRQGDN